MKLVSYVNYNFSKENMVEQIFTRQDEGHEPKRIDWVFPEVTIVIPTLNEEANLPFVLPRIPKTVREILIVDGHSTDNTVLVAPKLHPKVRVLKQTGRGKGDALRCGFAHASGDIIVTLDADGSMRPEELPRFLAPLCDGFDFVKGTRFKGDGGSSDMGKTRMFGNLFFVATVNFLHGTNYSDMAYGYAAFRKRCIDSIKLESDGFAIETEINIKLKKSGARIIEIPSFEDARKHGTSNLHSLSDGFRILFTIFKERLID